MVCTFFGHKDTPSIIREPLTVLIRELINKRNVNQFYVGNQGKFDSLVYSVLKEIKKECPQIEFCVVLAYMPVRSKELYKDFYEHTIYPEGLEKTPAKFAILKRNEWMIKKSDIVISYVTDRSGNSHKFVEYATKQNKEVINIAELIEKFNG